MSMWPPPFLWSTIIGRCWPGVHSWSTREKSVQKGMVCQNLKEDCFFGKILAIIASTKQFGYKKKATFPVDTREEVSQKPFFTAVAKVAA